MHNIDLCICGMIVMTTKAVALVCYFWWCQLLPLPLHLTPPLVSRGCLGRCGNGLGKVRWLDCQPVDLQSRNITTPITCMQLYRKTNHNRHYNYRQHGPVLLWPPLVQSDRRNCGLYIIIPIHPIEELHPCVETCTKDKESQFLTTANIRWFLEIADCTAGR